VLEKMILRRIIGPRRDEVTGRWRKLHNAELQNLCSPPTIIRMTKSRWMRLVGHVACMGEEECIYDTGRNASCVKFCTLTPKIG
jgi:hypothetical protein